MRKKLCIAALAVMLIVTAAGCRSHTDAEYPWSITKSTMDEKSENEHIVMQLADDTPAATGARFTLHNTGEQDISFGSEYAILIYVNDAWYDIEIGDVDWTGELITVEAGGAYTAELDWSSVYGELPAGRYRIVKEYNQENQAHLASCEFEIS